MNTQKWLWISLPAVSGAGRSSSEGRETRYETRSSVETLLSFQHIDNTFGWNSLSKPERKNWGKVILSKRRERLAVREIRNRSWNDWRATKRWTQPKRCFSPLCGEPHQWGSTCVPSAFLSDAWRCRQHEGTATPYPPNKEVPILCRIEPNSFRYFSQWTFFAGLRLPIRW